VLNVGELWSYTAHHTVTQADIDGSGGGDSAIANTVTADSDQTGPDSATASVLIERAAQLEILKKSDVSFVDEAGDVINYTISIEDTGSTTLTNPVVNDQVRVPVLNPGAPVLNLNAQFFFPIFDGDFNLGDTTRTALRIRVRRSSSSIPATSRWTASTTPARPGSHSILATPIRTVSTTPARPGWAIPTRTASRSRASGGCSRTSAIPTTQSSGRR
jgi:uncharacterized repeat protein (TIGR01451 family)